MLQLSPHEHKLHRMHLLNAKVFCISTKVSSDELMMHVLVLLGAPYVSDTDQEGRTLNSRWDVMLHLSGWPR